MKTEDGSKLALELVSRTEQGRRVIWDILSFCGVYQDMAGESNDVFKQLGKREVGLHILGLITDIDEEIIFDMMRESKTRATIEEINNERSNNGSTSSSTESNTIYTDIIGTDTGYDHDGFGKHKSGGPTL